MRIKSKTNPKIITKDNSNQPNGFLVPIYNVHDGFFDPGKEPMQVYLTVISPRQIKGPHLHHIRNGCFTCIKGNARFVLKTTEGYQVFYSGESHEYRSVIVPAGVPAAAQNLGDDEVYILNMPNPAWTPTMNDEYTADFSDFEFGNANQNKRNAIPVKQTIILKVPFKENNLLMRTVCVDDLEHLRKFKNANRKYFFHKDEILSVQQHEWFRAYANRDNDYMFVILDGENQIGCMGIRLIEGVWDVYNIILGDQQYSKCGIMGTCYQEMLSFSQSLIMSPIVLKVLKINPAVTWYKKQGFEIVSDAEDYYVMKYMNSNENGDIL